MIVHGCEVSTGTPHNMHYKHLHKEQTTSRIRAYLPYVPENKMNSEIVMVCINLSLSEIETYIVT